MTPTRLRTLLLLVLAAGAAGYALAASAYGELPKLPAYTALTAALMGLFELGLARVVSLKIRGRSRGKAMHPLQVARAVVLAKASSAGGSLVMGLYGGFLAWTLAHRELSAASDDSRVASLTVGGCLLLVLGALLLERACRTPRPRD